MKIMKIDIFEFYQILLINIDHKLFFLKRILFFEIFNFLFFH